MRVDAGRSFGPNPHCMSTTKWDLLAGGWLKAAFLSLISQEMVACEWVPERVGRVLHLVSAVGSVEKRAFFQGRGCAFCPMLK